MKDSSLRDLDEFKLVIKIGMVMAQNRNGNSLASELVGNSSFLNQSQLRKL